MNSCRGVVSGHDFLLRSEDETTEGLCGEGVTTARFEIWLEAGVRKKTRDVILTFVKFEPDKISVGYEIYYDVPLVPNHLCGFLDARNVVIVWMLVAPRSIVAGAPRKVMPQEAVHLRPPSELTVKEIIWDPLRLAPCGKKKSAELRQWKICFSWGKEEGYVAC